MAKRDLQQTLLGQCVIRAGRVHIEGELAGGRDPHTPPNKRETVKALWRSTSEGSKVALLVVLWAMALDELQVDELGVEQFVEWNSESRATVHRRLQEFRRAWPEFDTPNELAHALLEEARRRGEHVGVNSPLPVLA